MVPLKNYSLANAFPLLTSPAFRVAVAPCASSPLPAALRLILHNVRLRTPFPPPFRASGKPFVQLRALCALVVPLKNYSLANAIHLLLRSTTALSAAIRP